MIPKLRFPGFSGEWVIKELGNLLKIGSGRDYKHLGKGDIPVYGTGGLMLHVDDYLYDGKSICIGRKGTIDQPQFLSGKFWTVDTLFYTHSYKDSIPEFIYPIFQKINWQKWNEASGVPSLSKTTIESIKVTVPKKEEQEKIAGFLTVVNERIAAMDKKVELLQQYKKGVMQKIFTQKLRFKDENGQGYPAWQIKNFNDTIISLATNNYQIRASDYAHTGRYPVIDQGQKYIVGYSDRASKVFHNVPVIIFGDHTTLLKYVNFDFIIGADGTKVFQARDKDNLRYLFYFLCQNQLTPEGYKRHFSVLQKLQIVLPCKGEQQKIADFLTSLDDKINLEKTKLVQAKLFKKSLLQRMFV